MPLTTDDLNAVRAQWEEWTADSGFYLFIEVRSEMLVGEVVVAGGLAAHLAPSLYCQVEVWCGPYRRAFSERIPYDAAALRASVIVLARTIAGWTGDDVD